jgi:phosphate:Na+ symporter
MVNSINPTTVVGLIFGGVLALLYGIHLISDAMRQEAGVWLQHSLMWLSRSPLIALGMGIGMTLLTQSSGATSSLLVGLVNAQVLPLTAAIITLLGTNIGSALTVLLLIFHVTDLAFVFVGVGSAIALWTRRTPQQGIGQACFGFALIMLGLAELQEGSHPFAASPLTRQVFVALAQSPLVLALLGVIVSMAFASSLVSISLVMLLASNGAISLTAAMAMLLGSNVGSAISVLLSALMSQSLAGRRLALVHVGSKLPLAAVALLALDPLSMAFTHMGLPIGTRVALAHLAFNLIVAMICAPLAPWLTSVMEKVVPERTTDEVNRARFLHPAALKKPAEALGQAMREVLHMTDLVSQMLDLSLLAFQERQKEVPARIARLDDQVDDLNRAVKLYLLQLEEEKMSSRQKERQRALLSVIMDLEAMGDLLDKQCMPLAHRKEHLQLSFSPEGWQELTTFHHAVAEAVQQTFAALAMQDPHLVTSFFIQKKQLNQMKQTLHLRHLRRLQGGTVSTQASSAIHLDLLTTLRHVLSHASAIAHAIQEDFSGQESGNQRASEQEPPKQHTLGDEKKDEPEQALEY